MSAISSRSTDCCLLFDARVSWYEFHSGSSRFGSLGRLFSKILMKELTSKMEGLTNASRANLSLTRLIGQEVRTQLLLSFGTGYDGSTCSAEQQSSTRAGR